MTPTARRIGAAGALFAGLDAAALALQMRAGFPPSGESSAEIAAYFAAHGDVDGQLRRR